MGALENSTLVFEDTYIANGRTVVEKIYQYNPKSLLIWNYDIEYGKYYIFFCIEGAGTQRYVADSYGLDDWISEILKQSPIDVWTDTERSLLNSQITESLRGLDASTYYVKSYALNYHRIMKLPPKTRKMMGWKI